MLENVMDQKGSGGTMRILDLTGPEGYFCGRLLADLGSEVIKVEPPEGDIGRYIGPFKGDKVDPESSLSFIAFNTNKKSVTLDLTSSSGRNVFRKLVHTADAVIENFPPGTLEKRGLSYEALKVENPGLVMASVTGFGLSGPHSHFQGPNIVASAMGGVMHLSGEQGKAPLCDPEGASGHVASAFAAYGVLTALYHRDRTGRGQLIEISNQEMQAAQQHNVVNYSSNFTILERSGSRTPIGGGMPYGVYPTGDGYAHLVVISPAHWRSFIQWMGNPEVLSDSMWENRHIRNANADFIDSLVVEFTRQFSKNELFSQGQARHITVAPINRPDEFIRDPHAENREMFVDVHHPVIGTHKLLRSPLRMSETPTQIIRPSPTIGQHNDEILGRLKSVTIGEAKSAQTRSKSYSNSPLPLHGIRVLDFSQAIAGPILTRILAENGAEVIKVESEAHQQRGKSRPGLDPAIALQQRVTFADANRNKRCITVNMGTEEGRNLIRRLVPYCDVVVDNFSPRVMERWGLSYSELQTLRPDIIMARLPGFGLTGPYRDYVGLAAVAMGITGVLHMWSYQDKSEPAGPPIWLPDYLSAACGGVAIMASIRHRDCTGKGQLIELGQVDATATVLGNVYLDYDINGRVAQPLGNRHRSMSPHGVYRCKGLDAWCAIAVRNQEEWDAFCDVLGAPTWSLEERFATLAQRMNHQDDLDRKIEAWTSDYTPRQVMYLLQRAGVPAGAVQNAENLFNDPHLRKRNFFVTLDDADVGPVEYPGQFIHLSETPGEVQKCHQIGEDNDYVFGGLLKISKKEIRLLEESGVVS
jgi:crotonobetainyl-CoA:carnitine CoA-transferase CaiB-like acyl-CoA transferase